MERMKRLKERLTIEWRDIRTRGRTLPQLPAEALEGEPDSPITIISIEDWVNAGYPDIETVYIPKEWNKQPSKKKNLINLAASIAVVGTSVVAPQTALGADMYIRNNGFSSPDNHPVGALLTKNRLPECVKRMPTSTLVTIYTPDQRVLKQYCMPAK